MKWIYLKTVDVDEVKVSPTSTENEFKGTSIPAGFLGIYMRDGGMDYGMSYYDRHVVGERYLAISDCGRYVMQPVYEMPDECPAFWTWESVCSTANGAIYAEIPHAEFGWELADRPGHLDAPSIPMYRMNCKPVEDTKIIPADYSGRVKDGKIY